MNDGSSWPVDKLSALRLGRRLVAEIPASRPGRRAFVDVRPKRSDPDVQAQSDGWVRSDAERSFRLEHWEYDRDGIDGFHHDIGAVLIGSADATDESELITVLDAWGARPGLFVYPWESEDPK
ncbi:hypothetical protein [Streptomyces europaeiscabiei]|uniref:Uncharacterized protein n=1 Tax=Streptomyces europaeiscabiei TaxID=146819 RepID=A0ABU4NVA9_9ACTN|nr:hypothetical protein [Streptomyces europaeiscabiei]MDX2769683.1 hypothetical protein [Streptomyces europaeiscabiei]MDX3549251.1 hypothetical protein [Streptomyces europaeiscabiei]MDX3558385.1 hypothetical protein [Streptomyces europaeiscabiei]MDX3706536.1 hypothetical protein [Streptomyces europaeiscabiei]MDX3784048.1 hypothetical protein [Streptomyces europaeiscabiei]